MYFILKGADFSSANLGQIEVKEGSVGTGGSGDSSTTTYTLTVEPTPSTATVTLTASGFTQSGNSITVTSGTKVSYEISATGYVTKSGDWYVYSNTTKTVTLNAEGATVTTYTLTINPTPSDATVIIDGVERKTITVDENNSVDWSVSKTGYTPQSDVWLATENKTMNITLVESSSTISSLDDIAWEDKTYRDIFITNNRAPNINGNSMTNSYGNITYTDSAGSTTIVSDPTAADNYVPPYSLYVTGTSSQQAKSNTNYASTTSYFLAANVKVTDYTKGYCGIIFGSQFGACASTVTDGYEVFSFIGDNTAASTSSTALFIGSASSANLTGYINNPVAIDMSIFTTAPTLEELTNLYKNYTAKLIAG